jgi:hypothetical protein
VPKLEAAMATTATAVAAGAFNAAALFGAQPAAA